MTPPSPMPAVFYLVLSVTNFWPLSPPNCRRRLLMAQDHSNNVCFKKNGQIVLPYHYCGLSRFFLKQTLVHVTLLSRLSKMISCNSELLFLTSSYFDWKFASDCYLIMISICQNAWVPTKFFVCLKSKKM